MRKFLLSALSLLAFFGAANAATVTDELTSANFAATGQSYVVTNPVNGTSGAVYYAQTATQNLDGTDVIQLRATNPSGIVTTTSPGKVKKVTVEWNGKIDRTVDVYVSNSPYSTGADLYAAATQGSKAGSIKCTAGQTYVEIEGDYAFVAIRSNKSALYLNKVEIEWETSDTPAKGSCGLAWDPTTVTWTLGAEDNVMPTLANPHNLAVTYSSSDTNVATVDADGVVTAVAAGDATITAATEGDDDYAAGEATFSLTVKAPIVGVELAATINFADGANTWGLPTGYTTGENEYTDGTYTITLDAAADGYKMQGNNVLIIGKKDATLTLPAFDFPVAMIKTYAVNGSSGKVTFNVYNGENAVSTEATATNADHEFPINATEGGIAYTIKVTNANNAQFGVIEVYKAEGAEEPELHYVYANNVTGYENIYAYAWSGETPNEVIASAPWPGTAMEWDEDLTVWKVGFASVPEYIIFNNGGEIEDVQPAWQTEDLEFVENNTYTLSLVSFPKHVYLIGSYNNWDRYNPIELTVDADLTEGTFSTGEDLVNLNKTTWFRFCTELAQSDDDWTLGTQYGASENDEPIVFGEEGNYMGYAYECGNSWKINPGQYVFILNFDMYEQPVLWIMGTEAEVEPDYDLYVMGSHNEWTANDLSKMATEDNVTYTHTTTFPAKSEFAIATSDWGTKYGTAAIGNAEGDTEYTLTEGGANITVPNKLENASLTFDRDAKTLTVSVPTGVAVIDMEEGTVRYYNLQGVEVAQPENGVFITVKGGKVSKQIIR